MSSKAATSPPNIDAEAEAARVREVLRRAVARVCPGELSSQREDIVQAAMVRLLERQGRGEELAGRPASYLWKVAFTTALDELRRTQRRREVKPVESSSQASAQEETPELAAPAARPELRLAMTGCLGQLVPSRRQAVALYLHGFTAEEAARSSSWTVKRTQNLIFRGLQDLRRCLTQKGYSP
jgi:RNA polymerase sigma-70 factor (ECF subfamily)